MPVPRSRSPEQTVDGLERWFRDQTPTAAEVTVTIQPSPRATGFSCETVLFDVDWRAADGTAGRAALAARVEPSGYSLYLRHDLERQWRIIQAVGEAGTVPVPRIIGHCDEPGRYLDRPFFVMERIDGVNCADAPPYSVRGWLKEAGADRQRGVVERSIEVLARVHAIDTGALPTAFLERDIPAGLAGQVAEFGRYLEWVADGRSVPELTGAHDWLRASIPGDDDETFCWGDARLGNMLFRDDRPVAVLDWEMACVAPPESDVAWWLVFDRIHTTGRGLDRLAGFPPEPEQIVLYEKVSGRTLSDLRWYQVWAAVRAAALLFRFHDMLLVNGMAPADPAHAAYQPALQVLRDLLEGDGT